MKIRSGFVSNSSSSSFIVIYDDIYDIEKFYFGTSYRESMEKIAKEIEEVYLNDPNFAIIFKQGSSGDCEKMMVQMNKEIINYIREQNLFRNKVFISLLDRVIILKRLVCKEDEPDFEERVGSYKRILDLAGNDENSFIDFRMNLDDSSIFKDTNNAFIKFKDYLERRNIFNPDYQRFGDISESYFNTLDEDDKEFYMTLAGELE